ncbi:hypothetical protein BU24DRAFT_429403 [Aaosphaeria arxii CBS 175.79]|uniref:Uncharacterized protein n=1 Tax=Aaosphaeria arxii CBS 175.79 TaxID=1450172 RepID=A0A6A5X626_9PLEO|nr:uncharacterized protein BU24DRAFT_429403 [Aaosphaeria arxii CBS 175.79]KAF2008372.1 hypothetical protein BU24DRAFT_429403 [Aaosphaeria arxii CBS 175.79]
MANRDDTQAAPTGLPEHVSIYSPSDAQAGDDLFNAQIFTRLSISSSTSSRVIATALATSSNSTNNTVSQSFCVQHNNVLLVFDTDTKDDCDLHHEHVRTVCLMLKDHDYAIDYARCVFDAVSAQQAGFQFDKMNGGSILIVDIMALQDEEDDTSSDEGEDNKSTENDSA